MLQSLRHPHKYAREAKKPRSASEAQEIAGNALHRQDVQGIRPRSCDIAGRQAAKKKKSILV